MDVFKQDGEGLPDTHTLGRTETRDELRRIPLRSGTMWTDMGKKNMSFMNADAECRTGRVLRRRRSSPTALPTESDKRLAGQRLGSSCACEAFWPRGARRRIGRGERDGV